MDFGVLKTYTVSGQRVELQFEGGEARRENPDRSWDCMGTDGIRMAAIGKNVGVTL